MSEGESWYQIFDKLNIPVVRRGAFQKLNIKERKREAVFVAVLCLDGKSENHLCSDTFPSEEAILAFLSVYQ